MKTTLTLLIFCIGAVQLSALQAQDLGRTNSLVNQALQIADAARANSYGGTVQAPIQQGWSNPFATSPLTSTVVGAAPNGTGVAVSGSNIRVNAGGLQLDIPRTGAAPIGPGTYVGAGMPNIGIAGTNALQSVQHWRNFADAVNSFHSGQFDQATSLMGQVNATPTTVPAFNHFHALCTFAEGDFDRSAELAYAGLAQNQPLYSWDQLRGYYKDPAVYTQQYQTLQAKAAAANAPVSTQFLLGYHHLMLGHRQHANQVFEQVLTQMPNDPVIRQTLTITQQAPPQPQQ